MSAAISKYDPVTSWALQHDPVGYKIADNVISLTPTTPAAVEDAPAPEAPTKSAAAAELAPAEKADTPVSESAPPNSFSVRQSMNVQRAAAAGATKTANDADLLGYVTPKRRSQARAILG